MKGPSRFSDTGSCVYRRADAVVRSPEYNTHFITQLQLTQEGRIAAKAGYDWASVIENARIRWMQLDKKAEVDKSIGSQIVMKLINSCFEEKLNQLVSKVEENKEQMVELELKLDKKLEKLKREMTEAIVQSLLSSDDVGQAVPQRFKKRKRRRSLLLSKA